MKPAAKLSLITYNIHKGFGFGRLRFLLPEMRQSILELNPDLVFLQEVQGQHRRRAKRIAAWPDAPQFAYMAESLWPYYIYAKNAIYQAGHHGNAILSKYPFAYFDNVNLSSMNRASRSILHGQIQLLHLSGSCVTAHLLCIHFGLFKKERREQYQILLTHIRENIPTNEPLIMAGDFNDWQNHLSVLFAEELGIHEAFFSVKGQHARSFPAIKPTLCIDRVYFRGLKVSEVRCLHGKPWRRLSDHIPLFASFELTE